MQTNPDPFPLPGVPNHIPIRLHLLWLILARVHEATNRSFIKSVKINCSDFVQGGLDEAQSEEMIKEIVAWKMVDVLEISGGNYSSPGEGDVRPGDTIHLTSQHLPRWKACLLDSRSSLTSRGGCCRSSSLRQLDRRSC